MQFDRYGSQKSENGASITREEQQRTVVEEIVEFLKEIEIGVFRRF